MVSQLASSPGQATGRSPGSMLAKSASASAASTWPRSTATLIRGRLRMVSIHAGTARASASARAAWPPAVSVQGLWLVDMLVLLSSAQRLIHVRQLVGCGIQSGGCTAQPGYGRRLAGWQFPGLYLLGVGVGPPLGHQFVIHRGGPHLGRVLTPGPGAGTQGVRWRRPWAWHGAVAQQDG